ncbi:MAG: hypothetical protein KDK89_13725 [Alphaproteobacteria bacterium]|nr:hypothetical protein [Alphaproteobacteria bacterium]
MMESNQDGAIEKQRMIPGSDHAPELGEPKPHKAMNPHLLLLASLPVVLLALVIAAYV